MSTFNKHLLGIRQSYGRSSFTTGINGPLVNQHESKLKVAGRLCVRSCDLNHFISHLCVYLWWSCVWPHFIHNCRGGTLWSADFTSSESNHSWYLSHFDLVRFHRAVLSHRETPAGRRRTCSTQRVMTQRSWKFGIIKSTNKSAITSGDNV